MNRTILACAFLLFGLSSSILGCSRASVICELACECEHCNDQNEIEACNALETAENIAEAYDCGDVWEAYTVCIEERGTCDQDEARFTILSDTGENRCQDERDALDDCVDDASGHDGFDFL